MAPGGVGIGLMSPCKKFGYRREYSSSHAYLDSVLKAIVGWRQRKKH